MAQTSSSILSSSPIDYAAKVQHCGGSLVDKGVLEGIYPLYSLLFLFFFLFQKLNEPDYKISLIESL